MNTAQETKWIHRIKLFGSSKDADSLVRAYYDEIYIFAARQISDKELASDLTQEIFISMLRSIASYQEKQSSFRTWLYRIATNKIIDFRRKALPNVIPLEELDETETVDYVGRIDYENNIAQAEFLEKIEHYVSSFRLDVQQIFRLHVIMLLNLAGSLVFTITVIAFAGYLIALFVFFISKTREEEKYAVS